jgi:hypothetical protein
MSKVLALANTEEERERIYRFRYAIYVEEMGKPILDILMGRALPLALIALLAVLHGDLILAAPPTSITPNGFGTSVSGVGGY